MSDGFIVTSRFGNAPKQSSSACIVPQIATDLDLLQIHLKNQHFEFNKTSIYIIYNSPVAFGGIYLFLKELTGFYQCESISSLDTFNKRDALVLFETFFLQ